MADEAPKGRKGKQQEGVLAGLPATRPSRMSRRARGGGPSVEATRAAATHTADTREATGSRASGKRTTAADKTRKPRPAAAKAPVKTAVKAPAKAAAKAPAAKAPAAKAPAAKAPAKTAAKAPARKPAAAKPSPAPAPAKVAAIREAPKPPRKPRAVRVGAPTLKEPTEKAESRREDVVPVARPAQSGTELVTTVVQAAGELASIGVTIGGQIIKRAAQKLPRP